MTMQLNRNMFFALIGALCAVIAMLGYKLYQHNKQPEGVQINLGPAGVSIQKK